MVQVRELYNKNSKIGGIAIAHSIADKSPDRISINQFVEITGFIHIENY
jgi:hypothetical protein